MDFDPNFSAGYYQGITFLLLIVVLAVPYQATQIWRLNNRTKRQELVDLPTTALEKSGRLTASADLSNVGRMSVAAMPDASKVHFGVTVQLYKIWNSVFSLFGIGDMSVGEIFLFMVFVTINLVFLFAAFQAGEDVIADLNLRSAYVALANAAFVFPLATRNSILLTLLGVPFERVIKYHRWCGRMIFALIAFHGSYQVQTQYQATHKIYDTLFGQTKYSTGFWAFVSLAIIMITSQNIIRRRFFELFYWSHFCFIFFIIFGVLHTDWFLPFVGLGVSLYVVDRMIRVVLSLRSVNVIEIQAIKSSVTRVIFQPNFSYEAGQYIFVNFPNLHSPLSLIQWHPVSLSSDPNTWEEGPHYSSIHMKALGGFTKKLYARSQEGNFGSLRVKIDGPYGRPSLDFTEYRTVMLVAGGIGVTPIISTLRDLVYKQANGMPIKTQSVYFVWVVPDYGVFSCFESEITEVMNRASYLPQDKYLLDIKVFITRKETTPSSIFFKGRPEFNFLIEKMKQYHGSGDIAVGVCGQAELVKSVQDAAIRQSDAMGIVKVHKETFEF